MLQDNVVMLKVGLPPEALAMAEHLRVMSDGGSRPGRFVLRGILERFDG